MWMRLGGGIYEGVREIEMFGWDGRVVRWCVSRETYTPIVRISVLLLRECDVRSVPETDEAQSKFPANPLPHGLPRSIASRDPPHTGGRPLNSLGGSGSSETQILLDTTPPRIKPGHVPRETRSRQRSRWVVLRTSLTRWHTRSYGDCVPLRSLFRILTRLCPLRHNADSEDCVCRQSQGR
jgi:hypothetical protein